MSRSRHPRPPAPAGDELSRVTQAAISLADELTRLQRAQARLSLAVAAARESGKTQGDIERAVQVAARGRVDRRKALESFAGGA